MTPPHSAGHGHETAELPPASSLQIEQGTPEAFPEPTQRCCLARPPVSGDNVRKGKELGIEEEQGAPQEATCPATSGRWTPGSQTRPLNKIQGTYSPGTSSSHSQWVSPTINPIFSLTQCERTGSQAHTRAWPVRSWSRKKGFGTVPRAGGTDTRSG